MNEIIRKESFHRRGLARRRLDAHAHRRLCLLCPQLHRRHGNDAPHRRLIFPSDTKKGPASPPGLFLRKKVPPADTGGGEKET